jgi:hypothetical protein
MLDSAPALPFEFNRELRHRGLRSVQSTQLDAVFANDGKGRQEMGSAEE